MEDENGTVVEDENGTENGTVEDENGTEKASELMSLFLMPRYDQHTFTYTGMYVNMLMPEAWGNRKRESATASERQIDNRRQRDSLRGGGGETVRQIDRRRER